MERAGSLAQPRALGRQRGRDQDRRGRDYEVAGRRTRRQKRPRRELERNSPLFRDGGGGHRGQERSALPQSPLERAEQLEQLRALQNGIPIRVVLVDRKGRTHWSVDTPDDAKKVEEIIAREGELVPA